MKMKENVTQTDAIVCEVQRKLYTLICEHGEIHAKLRGVFYKENDIFPVVGDKVLVTIISTEILRLKKFMKEKASFQELIFQDMQQVM